MRQRTLIRNATIYDGTGGRPFFGDVLIGGGLIRKIGRFLHEEDCTVVDGSGKILTPGFINCHSPVSYTHLDVYKRQISQRTAVL